MRREAGLFAELRRLLDFVGARPASWVTSTVAVSVALAALDTVGVAAMIPLTQLISGAEPDAGVLGAIADATGMHTASELIPVVAAAIVVLFVLKSAATLVFRWWLLGRTSRLTADAAAELLRRYVLAPYTDHRTRRLGEVYRNVNDATAQSASVLLAVIGVFSDLVMLAALIAVLTITSPVVTLIAVGVFTLLVAGLQRALRHRQSRVGEEMAQSYLEAWQVMLPSLDGFREARLTASGSRLVDAFHRARLKAAEAARTLGILSDVPRYSLEIGFVIAIGGVSTYLFATGTAQSAITTLGVFAAASLRALPTLTRVAANFAIIRTGRIGLGILLRASDELERGGRFDEQPRFAFRYAGDIEIEDLSFRYPDADVPVIDGLSLTIPEDSTIAFVGSSGAGKSTLLDLLLGLLEPTDGAITCGGQPILDDRAAWYDVLGVVPQDVFLINDTIRANIAFGADPADIDQARVDEAVRMALLIDLIDELPDGIDTVVGERGVRVSGGQRQRIGIARALYRAPRVLILDEATSALDNATEHEIAETLSTLAGRMTIIIVAHRLSTIRNADSIVFLKSGRIEAQGTFTEVRTLSPDFARLVELGRLD